MGALTEDPQPVDVGYICCSAVMSALMTVAPVQPGGGNERPKDRALGVAGQQG